jgi:hypothetical protein
MSTLTPVPEHEPVLTVEPVNDEIRAYFRLSPDARLALFEHHQGHSEVVCTDNECAFGINAAARAWAEATGAAWTEAA